MTSWLSVFVATVVGGIIAAALVTRSRRRRADDVVVRHAMRAMAAGGMPVDEAHVRQAMALVKQLAKDPDFVRKSEEVADATTKYNETVREVVAVCAPHMPAEAKCYICWDGGDLVRDCACRGPDAGFVHVGCIVKLATAKDGPGYHQYIDYLKTMVACGQCDQPFGGGVSLALSRANWLAKGAGCPKTSLGTAATLPTMARRAALKNLCSALSNNSRFDEAIPLYELYIEELQLTRDSGANDELCSLARVEVIEAECELAATKQMQIKKATSPDQYDECVAILTRCCEWRRQNAETLEPLFGLQAVGMLANMKRKQGQRAASPAKERLFAESEALWRETITVVEPALGENAALTGRLRLMGVLVLEGKLDEARALQDSLRPISERVLGPDHWVTRELREPLEYQLTIHDADSHDIHRDISYLGPR